MPSSPKKISVAVCAAIVFAAFTLGLARPAQSNGAPAFVPQQNSKQATSKKPVKKSSDADTQSNDDQDKSDKDDDENADDDPAAVTLDVSQESPLIAALYQATRATKEKDILAQLEIAKKLIDSGADVKAVDPQGRTALHWTVFGSSYNTKTKIIVAYEEIADSLIQKGVEINHEDAYQDTALDYLLYSPNFEMQTLLLENGATSGFLTAFYKFFTERSQELAAQAAAARAAQTQPAGTAASTKGATVKTVAATKFSASTTAAPTSASDSDAAAIGMPAFATIVGKSDLAPGQTLSVRLENPVFSNLSRTGDPVTATVTYPLCKNGEQVECKPGELILPPGTKINGTILFAQKAPNKYARPRLVLDFSNVLHSDGERSPLYARVLSVDNARETVENNEILGIIQPHANTKVTIAMAALSAVNPIAGYTIKGVQTVYGLSIRREIAYPVGTDLQIQIVRPSSLKHKETWDGYARLTPDATLTHVVITAPMRTAATNAAASDPTNLMFLGTRDQVVTAFGQAGWFEADDVNVKSAMKVAGATLRGTGYGTAPMSTLTIEGRPPDLMFQKSLNTFAKRHHLRIWKLDTKYNGQDVWIAAATHDIETTRGRANTKWNHRIDPHIDRERDWVATDILYAIPAVSYADIDRPAAPRKLANATGDTIVTDGKVSVLQLSAVKLPTAMPEQPAGAPKLSDRSVGAAKGPAINGQ
jgi:ankyrin repeat protein